MIQRWDDALMDARDGRYLRLRGIARRGFAEFLSLPGAAAFGNAIACHMARDSATLTEIGAACKAGGEPPAALIRLLDGRLASIDVVGFVEEFGDSILRLQARLGLLPAGGALQSHNVHAAPQQMSPEDLRLAEACTAIDRRLVAAARQRSMETGPIDHSALERAARGKYEGRLLDPPASILIEMGQGICSKGWHPCELHGLKRSRWIGPGPVAELDMRIDRSRALLIRLRADSHLSPRQVDGLRIHADGQALSTDHWALPPFDHFFEATVPPSPGAPPLLRLQIDSVQTLRPPNTGDPRLLGVEVGEIEVGPADGYIPRSLESLQTVRSKLSALAATTEKDWRMKVLLDSLPAAG